MTKQGSFIVPEYGTENVSLGFVPKFVFIEFVAKNDPDVGNVIMRYVIDNTGTVPYYYPQMRSETESIDFSRHNIDDATSWRYGKISALGNYFAFETTDPTNDFVGKTFNYYATNESAGTFTSASNQYAVVNVPKTSEDFNIFVNLPFAPDNMTTAWYVDCVEDMPSPTFDGEVRMSRWSIPSENNLYYIDPNSYPGDTGETGIINSFDDYFIFRSNGWNTLGVSCEYYLMPQLTDHIIEDTSKNYWLYNVISSSPNMQDATHKYFYKYKASGKLCLYEKKNEHGYDLILKGTDSIEQILYSTSYSGDYSEVATTETHFLEKSQVWTDGSKYYPLTFDTNILIFRADDNHTAEERANMYLDGDLDAEDADNYDKVAQRENLKLDGEIGEKVNRTNVGVSDLSFTAGTQVYALSNLQKGAFFNKLFDTNTTPIEDLLEGVQLFGSNEIGCIQGLHYIPFSASEVCTMGSQNYIMLGSYKMEFGESLATCLKNNKVINCGTHRFMRTYNDYRDFEPYCKLYVALPFIGVKELQISKYLNSAVKVEYACDITTGAVLARLYSNYAVMDTFEGNCATHLPISAVDHAQQTNAVITGLLNTAGATIGSVGSVAGAVGGAMGVAQAVGAGSIGSAIGGGASIGGNLLSSVANPVISGYQTMQASMSAPVTTRGSYAGNLGNFSYMNVTFIFAWLNTVVPTNEISLVGKPSNKGGAVGSFSGFLKCSAFNLADGYAGTQDEAGEIYSLVTNGIYL